MNTLASENPHEFIVLQKTARLTGFLYLVFAALGIYSFAYVQPKTIVVGDFSGTAEHMLANEFLFRTGVIANLLTDVLFVVIVLLLYRLFKHIDLYQAKLMSALVIVSVPVAIISDALDMTALSVFKGEVLSSMTHEQSHQWAMVFIKLGRIAGQLITLLWGLWLFPLAVLIYRSKMIPKIFAVLLVLNGMGYLVNCFVFVLFPEHLKTISPFLMVTYMVGEIPLIFRLIIKGIRVPRSRAL